MAKATVDVAQWKWQQRYSGNDECRVEIEWLWQQRNYSGVSGCGNGEDSTATAAVAA